MRLILRLILRVAALPAVGQAVLILALYSTEGWIARLLALIFVMGSVAGVLIWVGRTITTHAARFRQGETAVPQHLSGLLSSGPGDRSAVDQLAVVTRSMVFYALLIGYAVLAAVFGVTYDALELTTADSLLDNVYFSLTTLTTVGYGDIQPLDFGRFIASVEMMVGLSYHVLAIGGGMAYVSGLHSDPRPEKR